MQCARRPRTPGTAGHRTKCEWCLDEEISVNSSINKSVACAGVFESCPCLFYKSNMTGKREQRLLSLPQVHAVGHLHGARGQPVHEGGKWIQEASSQSPRSTAPT